MRAAEEWWSQIPQLVQMIRKTFLALSQAMIFWFSAKFSKRGHVQWFVITITLSDKQLSGSTQASLTDAAQPVCLPYLCRCIICINLYEIKSTTHSVITLSFATWSTNHRKGSATGLKWTHWSEFSLKNSTSGHAVPIGCPGEGDILPLTLASMFILCHEVNRGSDYHQCSLVNNNERIPFIFNLLFSVWSPASLEWSVSSHGFIMGAYWPHWEYSLAPSNSSVGRDEYHGAMKKSWLVTPLLWKDLLQNSHPATPLIKKRNYAAWCPPWITRIQIRRKKQKFKNQWSCWLS